MGSSDIYQVVEQVARGVRVACLAASTSPTPAIREQASPRHVPDEIIAVAGPSPHPDRQEARGADQMHPAGADIDDACQLAAVDDPDQARFFAGLTAHRRDC